ncbi:MAG TPA: DUF5107 domain-containing protein, partial [Phycisphaerae bacterium]|nr:DUF5107 domain-containing protein [Phycisphaerae bacterium]
LAPAEGGGGGDPQHALELLHAALTPSENLGEAFHLLQNNSELHYWSALAARAVGNIQLATQHFETAAASITDFQRMAVTAYSEATLWSGLALRELHRHPEARALFEAMLAHAHHLKSTPAKIDYFATSLPTMLIFDEDIQQSQLHRATLLEALALYGLNTSTDRKTARRLLNDLLLADPNHPLAADLLIALDWSP